MSLVYLEAATRGCVPVLLKFYRAPDIVEFVLGRFSHFTLQLLIQTSVAPELQAFVSSHEKRPNFRKTSTSQV